MKQPPSIQPMEGPGPGYDPMDRIIQDTQNIESFLVRLKSDPKNLEYMNTHLRSILMVRRTLNQDLNQLLEDPYYYPEKKVKALQKSNEQLFIYIEGVIGSMDPFDPDHFFRLMKEAEKVLLELDANLTLKD